MTLIAGDQRPFDADNHYYETLDAFTRHLDPAYRHRGVQVIQTEKRTLVLIGEKVNRFIPNPSFDPVLVPGTLDPYFRGQVPEGVDPQSLRNVGPLEREFQDRDHRLAALDEQDLAGILLFPTFACGVEQALRHDVPATMASVSAFNRWLDEDWGYHYQERMFAAPIIALADPDLALVELEHVLAQGARVLCVRPAPVPGPDNRPHSLGDRRHDPVWARIAASGVPVAFHLSDSGYTAVSAMWGGAEDYDPFHIDPFTKLVTADRAIHDTIGSLICHGVFQRHPTLKVASIENGAVWVPLLIKRLAKLANQQPKEFAEHPTETLRRHVWVAPYFEDDPRVLADAIGVERVLFGSDWPHGEGLALPADYEKELHDFSEAEVRRIMRDNLVDLLSASL